MIHCRFVSSSLLLLTICCGSAFAIQESPEADQAEATSAPPSWRGEFRSIKITEEPEASKRAWETRPYQVATWLCLDGSPSLTNSETEICQRIGTECQLIDPSGWNVNVGTPPSQWRWKLLNSKINDESVAKILAEPELEFYDKLMIIRMRSSAGGYDISVREIDARTQQIGPAVKAQTRLMSSVGSLASRLVSRAFMPIARIDEVTMKNEAELRARGIEACVRTEINEDLVPEVVTNTNSPCFVRDSDRLLPVVVRSDRSGNLVKLDPVPFTFIAIEGVEGSVINGKVYSSVRAPLAGRKSKRAEKLGLVIRPGDGTTVLRLVSRGGEEVEPLEGYDIATVEPDDITKELEYHGKTDWRGEIRIPTGDGMRMLLVRRGGRRLKKIPVIPGFRNELETTITADDTRLLATGVVTGIENEILSLAVLRQIYQKQIEAAIKDGKKDEARQILQTYSALENPSDLRARMADEEIRLRAQTSVQREKAYIQKLFSPLKKIASSDFIKNSEAEIRKWIDLGKVPDPPLEVEPVAESEPAAKAEPTPESEAK
jgi:hypothetical protein